MAILDRLTSGMEMKEASLFLELMDKILGHNQMSRSEMWNEANLKNQP